MKRKQNDRYISRHIHVLQYFTAKIWCLCFLVVVFCSCTGESDNKQEVVYVFSTGDAQNYVIVTALERRVKNLNLVLHWLFEFDKDDFLTGPEVDYLHAPPQTMRNAATDRLQSPARDWGLRHEDM